MKKTLIYFAFLIFFTSINAVAVDVRVESNHRGCAGLVAQIINGKTDYVTISKTKGKVDSFSKGESLPNSKIDSKPLRFNNAFFSALKSVEYFENNSVSPLKNLKAGVIYNFVITKDEVRFASTSRNLNAKNLASKHALLANNTDEVFYAGEAWLENGVLVINQNSGTYKPNGKYLSDVALYLQHSLEVEKVAFSDILPPAAGNLAQVIEAQKARFKAYVKSMTTSLEEFLVNLIARDAFVGKKISVDLNGNPGSDVEFLVEKHVGAGFFGVVHRIKIISLSSEAKAKFPSFMQNGNYRSDLVVKFPHHVPLLNALPRFNIFDQSIIKEADEINKIKDIVTAFDQAGADILFAGRGKNPFLIKQFVTASSVQNLAKNSTQLNAEQLTALKRDIFDLAKKVEERLQLDLDIKAENIAWDAVHKRFIMYEMSIKAKTTGFYIKDGFDGYKNYFQERLKYYSVHRNPASVNEIKMCSDNVLDVPMEFNKKFESELFDGVIDLKNKSMIFANEEMEGCFKVESVIVIKDKTLLNLEFKQFGKNEKRIHFNVVKENREEDLFLTRFIMFHKNEVIGHSIFSEASAN